MCLAQGPQRSDAGEARTRYPSVSSQALYHRATALPLGDGVNVGVPGQRVTEVLGSFRLFQLNFVDEIRCVDCFSFIGISDQFALIRVEVHLPVCFPVL